MSGTMERHIRETAWRTIRGETTPQIAAALGLQPNTVSRYRDEARGVGFLPRAGQRGTERTRFAPAAITPPLRSACLARDIGPDLLLDRLLRILSAEPNLIDAILDDGVTTPAALPASAIDTVLDGEPADDDA